LLLAKRGDHVLGCIALKPLEPPRVAEIKRLFVRPQARGKGIAKALIGAAVATAEAQSYDEIKLDTLPEMEAEFKAAVRNPFARARSVTALGSPQCRPGKAGSPADRERDRGGPSGRSTRLRPARR